MADTDKEFLEDLGGFDLKTLDQAEKEYMIPKDFIIGLAKGEITHAQLLGVTDESMQKVTEYAYALLQAGHFVHAQTLFDGLITLDPNVAYFRQGLALAMRNQGDDQSATEQYLWSINLDPKDITAHVNLAQILLDAGNKDEAKKLLQEAREIDPKGLHPVAPQVKRLWVAHFEPM